MQEVLPPVTPAAHSMLSGALRSFVTCLTFDLHTVAVQFFLIWLNPGQIFNVLSSFSKSWKTTLMGSLQFLGARREMKDEKSEAEDERPQREVSSSGLLCQQVNT